MKHLLKIWFLVIAMVMGGALPSQFLPESVTTQWSAQAKSKKKSKKKKKNKKKKVSKKKNGKKSAISSNKNRKKRSNGKRTAALASVPKAQAFASVSSSKMAANPLLRVGIPKGVANQVINYKALTVNFNTAYRIPNCVAYELTATMVDMADAPDHEVRKNYNYARDVNVSTCPENWEYRGSGYTRGHMAPAMDMRGDKTTMAQCFYMTNMCPQETKLNNDHWRNLEEKIHRWAKRDKRIMVFTGPIMGKNPSCIGKDKKNIAVPEAFFKVLYAPDKSRSIAFIYPNKPCPGSYRKYAVTIQEVERRTGLTFSSSIPKNQCDPTKWE